jgi:uncharacterized membrane protein YesL
MKRVSHNTYMLVFGVVYLGLATNAMLLVACLPEIALFVFTDPASTWPLIALAAPLCAPALTAAFRVFRGFSQNSSVVRTYWRGWRDTWRHAIALGAIATAVIVVLFVDAMLFAGSPAGGVLIPALAVFALVTVVVSLVSLVAVSEAPKARLRDVVRASAYLALRRWYLAIASIVGIAMQYALLASLPVLALGISAAPVLYLVWSNARYTLRPVLDLDVPAEPPAIPVTKEHINDVDLAR